MGIDLVEATLHKALGQAVVIIPNKQRYSAITFRSLEAEGEVTAVEGMDCRQEPGIVEVSVYPLPGDILLRHNDFRDRFGHAISVADQAEQAVAISERAARNLNILTKP
jgi:biotin carboxylase